MLHFVFKRDLFVIAENSFISYLQYISLSHAWQAKDCGPQPADAHRKERETTWQYFHYIQRVYVVV